jgi:hypothetical protein
MRHSFTPALIVAFACVAPAAAFGQGMTMNGTTTLAVDLRKVPVGSWAEYAIRVGGGGEAMLVTSRWSLVGRNDTSNTLEMAMEGQPLSAMGGSVILKLVVAPDPIGPERPIKQIVMKIGAADPMEMPLDMPGLPAQRFEKPDPTKIVGKEPLNVPAGTFKTTHYRDVRATATVDTWISDEVPPLGVIRVLTTPKPGAAGPGGQVIPMVTMELTKRGKDALSRLAKPARPFDPSAFGQPASSAPARR